MKLRLLPENIVADPVLQAGIVYACATVIAGLEKLGNLAGVYASDANTPWIIMTAFILFYTLFSSIFSLKTKSMNKYWGRAIFGYVGLCALSILVASLLSGISMDEAGTFRWLYVVFAIGYLVFLTIVRLMRRIVDMAIRQDEKLRGK